MIRWRRGLGLALVLPLCLAASAAGQSADELLVNAFDNVNDGVCSPEHCSLPEALEQARVGTADVVRLPPGIFRIQETIGLSSVTLLGAGPGRTVLDGAGRVRVVALQGFSTLADVTVRGGYADADTPGGPVGAGVLVVADRGGAAEVLRCVIEDNVALGDGARGAGLFITTDFVGGRTRFEDLWVRNNRAEGSGARGGGAYIRGSAGLERSAVVGNQVAGQDARGGGVALEAFSAIGGGPSLRQVTVADNRLTGNLAVPGDGGRQVTLVEGNFVLPARVQLEHVTIRDQGASGFPPSALASELGVSTWSTRSSVILGRCSGSAAESEGFNVEGPGDTCGLQAATDAVAAPVSIGHPPRHAGGFSVTVPLESQNPGLDGVPAEECEGVDQRGWERPVGEPCDAGALDRDALAPSEAPCVPDARTLCLQGGRFEVTALYRTQQGTVGVALTRPLTDDTGSFSFFDADNLEVFVKVLDACAFVDTFWWFATGLTDQSVALSVRDVRTGGQRHLFNPLFRPFPLHVDVQAFGACSSE